MQKVVVKSADLGATYLFDVTLKETHNFQNTITQHPVQTGAAINDHVYRQPVTFTWDIGQSDCRGIISGGSFSNSAQAFSVLENLWINAYALTITTECRQYTNMVIKSMVVTRDKYTMNGWKATVVFQEIIVTSAVEISVSQKNTSDPNTTGKTDEGQKPTELSTLFKTIQMSNNAYATGKANYKGTVMTLANYFIKYSSSVPLKLKSGNYEITPIIITSILNDTTFKVDGKSLSYSELLSTYGS